VLPYSPTQLGFLALVVALGTCVQTTIGFGAMLVSVTLGSLMLPVGELVPVLVPVALTQTAIVAFQKHRSVVWPLLLRRILPLMGIGLVTTILLLDGEAPWMKPALGVLILVLALRELLLGQRPREPSRRQAAASVVGIVAAGLVHGLFATGGPVLVWSLGQTTLDKAAFRATLTLVWLTLNTVLVGSFLVKGRADADTLLVSAALLPTAVLGIAAGHWLHDRVDEAPFRTVVWGALAVASLSLILR
jgi:hypothetical protein